MTAVGRAIGFDGYCLFGVDPLSGLRSVMFLLVRGSSGGPRSPRLYDILRPEGYASELRLALISGDRYWGAVSLFRDDVRHPFTDADVDAALDLSEPLSQAVRRYQTGRPGTQPLPRRPGVVMVDGDDVPVAVTREAHDWLVDLADSWRYGATEDDVSRIVLEVARAARAGREPVCRVRMPRGEWLVVSGSRVEDTDCDVAVVLQAGDLGTVAPAFAAWCGLSPKESEVLHLVASGLAAKQIARRLRLSVLTVNDHLKSVYRKAHVNSRERAALPAVTTAPCHPIGVERRWARGSPRYGRSAHRSPGLRSPHRGGPAVPRRQRPGAQPVRQHAEQHRHPDHRHRLVRRAPSSSRASRRRPATPAHGARTSRRTAPCRGRGRCPSSARATGTIRTSGEAQDGVQEQASSPAVDHDRDGDRAERQPHQQRDQRRRPARGRPARPPRAGRPRRRRPGRRRRRRRTRCRARRSPPAYASEGQREDGDAGEVLGGPSPPPGPPQQPAAGGPDGHADHDPDRELEQRLRQPRRASSPSADAAPASATRTTGVTIPSLSPLSTVISRRIRDGHDRVGDDGDAERRVGGRQRRADQQRQPHAQPGEQPLPPAPSRPAPSAAGRRPSRRSDRARRRPRRSWTRTRAASEKSTQTRVISASGLRICGPSDSVDEIGGASSAPTATKTIGAVRSAPVSRADTAPQRKTVAVMTRTAVVSTGSLHGTGQAPILRSRTGRCLPRAG